MKGCARYLDCGSECIMTTSTNIGECFLVHDVYAQAGDLRMIGPQ